MTNDSPNATSQVIPRLIVLAAVCVIVGTILSGTPLESANDRSRWATVWSLIHRRTWQIDEIDQDPRWSTIDKVRHQIGENEPYHFYSSKPPLLSAIAAAVYGVEHRLTGVDIRRDPVAVTRYTLLVINGLPMVLALFLFQRLLQSLELSLATQCFVLVLAGFGSMMNPYLSTLNNHTPAAVCLLICLTTIIRIQQRPEALSAVSFAVVGFTAALTCCFELPAALFGIVSFFWMLRLDIRRTLLWYVPAAVVPLAAYFITNWLVTGGIRPFYAFYGTDKYVYVHNGVPSYWTHPQGLDANTEGTLTYLFHCVLGHHGLLSHTPVFLLSIWGWLSFRRSAVHRGLSGVLPVGAILSVVVLAFYLSRTQNYNYGGNSAALRWMLWLTPFWWFALLDPVDRLIQSGKGRWISGGLLGASVITATICSPYPWRPSWIYGAMEQAGWIDYRTPVAPFDPVRHSVFSHWPQKSGAVGVWWLDGSDDSITLSSGGQRDIAGRMACLLDVGYARGNDTQAVPCAVMLDSFEAGEPVLDWLRVVNELGELSPPPAWLVDLMRGLPSPRPYTASGVRWLRPTPNAEGYRCERGASRVFVDDELLGPCWHRCDVWYSDQVPFGVLRWKQTIRQAGSGEIIQVRTWTAQITP